MAKAKPTTGPFAGKAWIPDIETESQAFMQRLRSMEHVLDYRHATAVRMGAIDGDRVTRVLLRQMPTGDGIAMPVRAFNVSSSAGGFAEIKEITPACVTCGCTEDRACVSLGASEEACAWAEISPPAAAWRCTACVPQ